MISRIKKIIRYVVEEYMEWKRFIVFNTPGRIGSLLRIHYCHKNCRSCGNLWTWLSTGAVLRNPQYLDLGNHVGLSKDVYINAGGGVSLEDYVVVGPGAKIWSVNHKYEDRNLPIHVQGFKKRPVHIGEKTWIGTGAIILPGIKIGRGVIVAAGAVVTKNVAEYCIVGGNPAKVIANRMETQSDNPSISSK